MTLRWRSLCAPTVFFLLVSIPCSYAVPMTKEQLFQLATLAAGDKQFDRSVELFEKVIEVDPKFAPAYNGLGLLHQMFEEGDINEAIRYFRMATEFGSGYSEAWNNLGRAYYSIGQFMDAQEAFLKSLEIKPDQVDVELALGWNSLLGQSLADEAIKYFNKVVARLSAAPLITVKDNAMIYYGLGLAYLMKGEKFKVLDAVTQLRKHHKEEQASKLETMVRENIRLTSKPGTPLVTGEAGQASLFDQQLKELEGGGFRSGGSKEGIKVRLKGPLL